MVRVLDVGWWRARGLGWERTHGLSGVQRWPARWHLPSALVGWLLHRSGAEGAGGC